MELKLVTKENKHTPLPWELAAESGVGMISSGFDAVVDFDWYDDNKNANAELIVKSVNAYEKHREIIRELVEVAEGSQRFMKSVPAQTDYLDKLIAKAKEALT